MLKIKTTAQIHKHGQNQYTGWVNEIRGVVAQGDSLDEVSKSLQQMLRCRLMLIFGTMNRPSIDGWYRLTIDCVLDMNGFVVEEEIKMY